jgi:hypothetical protein
MPVQFSVKDIIRSQWKLVQGFADEFWSKWTKEYMHTLQTRSKWENPTTNLYTRKYYCLYQVSIKSENV